VNAGRAQPGEAAERCRVAHLFAKQLRPPPVVAAGARAAGISGTWFGADWPGAAGGGAPLMLVEPGAARQVVSLTDLDQVPPRQVAVIVGPEGGWTPEELERGAGAATLVTMGARTLRADAMSVVALAALFTLWKEL
jgi:hypothetical protein